MFWYDYAKSKYGEKAKLCYMDTDSFIVYIKANNIYKDIAEDVETRFDTSNYELECNSINKLLTKGKNKKVIGLMKDESGSKIMTKFVGLRAKAYSCLIDDDSEDNKGKGTKKCVIKRKIKFGNYKNCLEATEIENKVNYLEKNKIDIDNLLTKDHEQFIRNNKSILKTQESFKSDRYNIFTEEINKIAPRSNDYKRIQSIVSIELYAFGIS